jgi:hypothetical protein
LADSAHARVRQKRQVLCRVGRAFSNRVSGLTGGCSGVFSVLCTTDR